MNSNSTPKVRCCGGNKGAGVVYGDGDGDGDGD